MGYDDHDRMYDHTNGDADHGRDNYRENGIDDDVNRNADQDVTSDAENGDNDGKRNNPNSDYKGMVSEFSACDSIVGVSVGCVQQGICLTAKRNHNFTNPLHA